MAQTVDPSEVKLKVEPQQLEKLVEWIRRSGKPQSQEAIARRYIEMLKEAAGTK